MINSIEDNELMKSFYNMMPYFTYYLGCETGFTISNTEKFLLVKNSEHLKINFQAGDAIPQGSAADLCLKNRKVMHTIIPEKVFGFPVETIAVPVINNNEVEGTLVLSMSVEKRQKISNLSTELSESLTNINTNTSQMSDTFEKINKANNDIEEFIKKTDENSKKTDDVLSFIQNIAKQTNLLGLNAAIESARAGEYGKGFSVVSSEIRNLSNSTKESINTISETLRNIQTSINEIYSRFEDSKNLLNTQTGNLKEITENMDNLTKSANLLNSFTHDDLE